jgi:2-phosphosulfolactate phosphatase
MEDTLFAGAVVSRIGAHFDINCDSARAAKRLYECSGGNDIIKFLEDSSHYKRLSGFGLVGDMEYCTTPDLHPVVPILKGRELVIHS